MKTLIEIDDLRVQKNGRAICVLSALRVAPGERVAVAGPNGSGKTTLLRVVAGLEAEYEGRCHVDASWRERAFVGQSPLLFRGTVLSNVTYGLRARGVHRAESGRRATECLERLGVGGLAGSGAAHLSGGETRRVALARALVLRPRLLLLDEPLADLDEMGAAAVAEALDAMPECTVVIASPSAPPDRLAARCVQLEATADATY